MFDATFITLMETFQFSLKKMKILIQKLLLGNPYARNSNSNLLKH